MISPCSTEDFEAMLAIVNNAAQAYRNVIPADCWHEPYMSAEYLHAEIGRNVVFRGFRDSGRLVGIMGSQRVGDVTLIRHAYVLTAHRRGGIGTALLSCLVNEAERPVLIGTWKAASWAISFYCKHGFSLVDERSKNQLLKKYWSISERQVETSVVLADEKWFEKYPECRERGAANLCKQK